VTLAAFGVGLILAIISILLGQSTGWSIGVQYSSTAAFVVAWDSLRFGIWKDPGSEPRWLKSALTDAAKSMSLLIILAIVAGLLAAASHGTHAPA
jgi:hypothetical protein